MSDVPAWLNALVEVVAGATTSHGVPGPLGFRYHEEDGAWDVLVYPLPVELVVGAHDGGVVSPCFALDLEQVRSAFTRVDDLAWTAHAAGPEGEGPCVSFEGQYGGQEVWLRALASAPDDEEPGMRLDTTGR